ncbi:L-threonine 3-dehydrogenase, mitochondrial-like [Corticium candelabrum]|uniref:L-threonine 3-dehydrogenase, mitochondrial-like n=1 Tax=Corticium candelabrum TaxID=121492 RepID=UPI002E2538D3|nr:L-threonine 3-dehydrogenase, mitochondrial-like [Corticium candelabrum]
MNYLRPVIGRVNLTNCVHSYAKPPRTLITGGLGQLGTALATRLREKYGRDSVILTDVKKPSHKVYSEGPYAYINILNYYEIESMVVNEGIDWIVNYSALLSAAAEANVSVAMDINMKGFENVLNVAKAHDLRVFCPSTIGAFGPTSPRKKTPDLTIQRPKTVYGVTKVYMELLGEVSSSAFIYGNVVLLICEVVKVFVCVSACVSVCVSACVSVCVSTCKHNIS